MQPMAFVTLSSPVSIGQVSSAVKVLRASASSENQNLEDGLMALQLPMKVRDIL